MLNRLAEVNILSKTKKFLAPKHDFFKKSIRDSTSFKVLSWMESVNHTSRRLLIRSSDTTCVRTHSKCALIWSNVLRFSQDKFLEFAS